MSVVSSASASRTPAIAPGSVVVVRDEEWLVQEAEETPDGLLIRVQGLSELVRDTAATFYENLEREMTPLDPAAATVVGDGSSKYRTARLWLEATLRKTPVPLGDRDLTVSTQALADSLSYQQGAVRHALDPANLRPRILLADAVGLGKTLEIGMILSELVRRGRGERILVVTPRHVLEQMQHELWTRFALPFVRLDSAGIQRVRQKLPATRNPFSYYKRVIVSIDTLKSEQYAATLRRHQWDAVVIDESHNVTNTQAQRNALARLLSRQTEALILASATPHNGKRESFAELVRLLDPAAIPPDGELAKEAVERLVVRRHRHSPEVASVVGADWAERQEPNNVLIPASEAENAVASELADTWLFPGPSGSPYSGATSTLFPWTLAKAFLSSPAALRETVNERRRKVGIDPAGQREASALDRLGALTDHALSRPSAKFDRLVAILRDIGVGPGTAARAVVFSERVATLRWLATELPKALNLSADSVEVLHGGLADDEQQRVVEEFRLEHAPVRILVTGDVASEGVNLHAQCHELIHFDIPWSLIRIEQRNGRIDRYGQRHSPRITSLLLEPDHERFSGDVRVLTTLMSKEHEAHRALGDVASLMGEYDTKAEEDAIRAVLAGQRELDAVVSTVDQVIAGDDLAALLAQVSGGAGVAQEPTQDTSSSLPRSSGLYPDEVSFLDDALHAAFVDPTLPPKSGGVSWHRDDAFGTAELIPPSDLAQRLEVLPQTYLADRRITERLVLATTQARGRERLAAALADDTGRNGSSWPDAHYLGPLHPVLGWAADRALASLARNQVFAVRGTVDAPTVLLLGTLTDRRGHTVAAAWLGIQFPSGEAESSWVTPFASAADALAGIGWDHSRSNPGPVREIDALTALIAPAVREASVQMDALLAAARADVERRVAHWNQRLDAWQVAATQQAQRLDLRLTRLGVQQEQQLVSAMQPDRQLVRPLLVVVPEDTP